MNISAEENTASAALKIHILIKISDKMDFVLSALEFVSVLVASATKRLQNSKICIAC